MKKLLHIIATPREEESRTLQVSEAFLEEFKVRHTDWIVDELHLSKEDLPSMGMKRADGKYVLLQGKSLYGDLKEEWQEIITHIQRFLSADMYLISSPMWNFHIPYTLKHYIDIIVQPKYLFRYTDSGSIEGLVKDKKMVVIGSYGGNYINDQAKTFNFHEPYLRTIFGFVGITDMSFVIAQPTDMGEELEKKSVGDARAAAKQLAERI